MDEPQDKPTQAEDQEPIAQLSDLDEEQTSKKTIVREQYRPRKGTEKDERSNLSLMATLLSVLISVFAIGQITIWLSSSSKITRYQSQVEISDLMVDQAYQSRGESDPQSSICLQSQGKPERIVYVICDSQKLIAEDEFEAVPDTSDERLKIRRFYDRSGTNIMAIDRYEYAADNKIAQINRVIFQNILFVARCAYIENIYGPTGILTQNKFTGPCYGNMVEIPALSSLRIVPPPPIVLFMPYR